jgi:hypothetical protein
VRETLEFYRSMQYDGVFLTNHFLDGNINWDAQRLPFAEKLAFYCQDYEEAKRLSGEIGIRVFFGVELSYCGTDFLVYGLDPAWYAAHPEILEMKKTDELPFLMAQNALVIQAHPFREDRHIDHIRLFPRSVEFVETVNACRKDEENEMAALYAKHYGLRSFAGTDNHSAGKQKRFAGMESETPIVDEWDFVAKVRSGEMIPFGPLTQEKLLQR